MKIDPAGDHDAVLNVQGDLPTIEPEAIRAAIAPLQDPARRYRDDWGGDPTIDEERTNLNVVKAVAAIAPSATHWSRALFHAGDGALG